jgi:hypothetical protein
MPSPHQGRQKRLCRTRSQWRTNESLVRWCCKKLKLKKFKLRLRGESHTFRPENAGAILVLSGALCYSGCLAHRRPIGLLHGVPSAKAIAIAFHAPNKMSAMVSANTTSRIKARRGRFRLARAAARSSSCALRLRFGLFNSFASESNGRWPL